MGALSRTAATEKHVAFILVSDYGCVGHESVVRACTESKHEHHGVGHGKFGHPVSFGAGHIYRPVAEIFGSNHDAVRLVPSIREPETETSLLFKNPEIRGFVIHAFLGSPQIKRAKVIRIFQPEAVEQFSVIVTKEWEIWLKDGLSTHSFRQNGLENMAGNFKFVRIFHRFFKDTHYFLILPAMKTIVKEKAIMMEEIRTLISEGKTVSLTVKGNSMNPFIVNLRDRITLGPWKDEEIRKGCVALVKDTRGNYLVHRIINREGNTVTLLGDGNLGLLETATMDNVIGIMYSIDRKGRTWTRESLVWRFYSWIWMLLKPVRRWPLGLWRRLFL